VRTVVTDHLDAIGVGYRVRTHTREALTAELAASERGVRLSQIVKCMVATDPEGRLYALLLPGDRRLKLRKARRGLGGIPLKLADREALAAELGLTVGAIAPFQLLGHGAVVGCDPTVLDEEWVDISSGDPLAGVELRSADLVRALDATLVDLVSDTDVTR
jgi:prolyl-tRNA editing enzyme YbaK/EbsC (Cys-tRNA(Pro) deacylase)